VKPAVKIRDFYQAVVGWISSEVDMGGYRDFCMNQPADSRTMAGVCHARGENGSLPPQWLSYINVANLKRSLAACRRPGGKVVCP
jgi:predicted enzyme related to lactoylglutathione lyase